MITVQVSELRGLPVMQDPPTFFISADQMAENVRESIEEEYTQEEADIEAEVFMLLDFIEPGTDLKEVFADLYAGSVVGYYDTDTGEMFVLNDGEDPTPASKYTLAHELIHALQDQTFDLDVFFPEDEENDDLARAKTALVEGDAVVGSSEYARSFLTRSETSADILLGQRRPRPFPHSSLPFQTPGLPLPAGSGLRNRHPFRHGLGLRRCRLLRPSAIHRAYPAPRKVHCR